MIIFPKIQMWIILKTLFTTNFMQNISQLREKCHTTTTDRWMDVNLYDHVQGDACPIKVTVG